MAGKKSLIYVSLFLLFGVHLMVVMDLPLLLKSTVFYIFQTRDIERALSLLDGNWIFFGPEMTGGGNLPGPFYYFLLAPALSLDPTWKGAWTLLVGLIFVGIAAGAVFLHRRCSLTVALLFASAYSLAVYPRRLTRFFLNTSYLLPFAIFIVIAMSVAFLAKEGRRKNLAFLACCFLIGLSLQLHFSAICFFVTLLVLHVAAPRLKIQSVGRKTFLWGLAAFVTPSLPYVVWRILAASGIVMGQENSYSGAPEQAPGVLLLLAGYVQSVPWEQFLSDAFFSTIVTVPAFFFPLAATFVFKGARAVPLIKVLSTGVAIGFLPFAYWFFAIIGFRYGVPFYISILFLSCALFHWLTENPSALRLYNILAGFFLLLVGAIWAVRSPSNPGLQDILRLPAAVLLPLGLSYFFERRYAARGLAFLLALFTTLCLSVVQKNIGKVAELVESQPTTMPTLQRWTRILRKIHGRTGWTYEETVRRLYFVNHHLEQDAKLVFPSAVENSPNLKPLFADGFFVALNQRGDLSRNRIRSWLLSQNIHQDIKRALEAQDIKIGPSLDKDFLLVPYWVERTAFVPKFFHNYGRGYSRAPEEGLFDEIDQPEGNKKIRPEVYLFKWNNCQDRHPFCSIGATVDLSEKDAVSVTVFGSSISQVTPWVSPHWTELLVSPYIEVICGSETLRFPLASSIGYARQYSGAPAAVLLRENNSFVAPFERRFEIQKCRKPIEEVRFGTESVLVETLYSIKELPGRFSTIRL